MEMSYFLTIPEIGGDFGSREFPNSIKLASYSFDDSISQMGSFGTSGQAGRVAWTSLSCVMEVSNASPKLFDYHSTGRRIQNMTLAVLRFDQSSGQQSLIWRYVFTDVYVDKFMTGGSGGGGGSRPFDGVTFNFARMNITPFNLPQTTAKVGVHQHMLQRLKNEPRRKS